MPFINNRPNPYFPKTKIMPDGGTGYHVGNGAYIAKPNYRWQPGVGYVRELKYGRDKEDNSPPTVSPSTDVEQPQIPENPGIRKEAFSTYGVTIPVSTGRRVVTGNIVDASDLVPRLIGGSVTTIEFVVPTYRTVEVPT